MDSHIKRLVEKYPNDFELGEKVRQLYWLQQENFFKEDDRSWIYESPDGGKSVTRRRLGADISTREQVLVDELPTWTTNHTWEDSKKENDKQLKLFDE